MRKNILMLVLALLVFAVGGCGGSADTGEETQKVYDNKISNVLKGTWRLNTSGAEGTATSSNGQTTLSLTSPIETQIIFSEISFSNTTGNEDDNQAGTISVFYSQNWKALTSEDADMGIFDIRSYTDDSATDKTRMMDIVHTDVNEWRISSTTDNAGNSDRINIIVTVSSDNEIKLDWTGEAYIEQQRGRYRYNFETSFRKASTSTDPDRLSTYDYDTEEENEKLIDILTGTWKVTNPYKSIKVDFEEVGTMLLISSDITFTDVNLDGDTGTAVVSIDQYWRVSWQETRENKSKITGYIPVESGDPIPIYDTDEYYLIDYTAFSLKEKTMNMARHGNNTNKWRCYFDIPENPTSNDITIIRGTVMNIEITSDNTITVIHEGIVDTPESYKIRKGNLGSNLITYDQIDFNYIKQ